MLNNVHLSGITCDIFWPKYISKKLLSRSCENFKKTIKTLMVLCREAGRPTLVRESLMWHREYIEQCFSKYGSSTAYIRITCIFLKHVSGLQLRVVISGDGNFS